MRVATAALDDDSLMVWMGGLAGGLIRTNGRLLALTAPFPVKLVIYSGRTEMRGKVDLVEVVVSTHFACRCARCLVLF